MLAENLANENSFQSPHTRESMTLLDSGFYIEDSAFRGLDPAQWIPDSQNGWIPIVFSDVMLSFVFRFRVRIVLY